MLTRNQVKMARAALGWSTTELARQAGITANTVTRFENGSNVTLATVEKMKEAFERAGIKWIPANGGPASVRPPSDE